MVGDRAYAVMDKETGKVDINTANAAELAAALTDGQGELTWQPPADAPRAAIAGAYAQTGEWPDEFDPALLGLEAATYVESVQVSEGVIFIRYGKGAHRLIAGSTLALHPTGLPSGEVTWNCGYASPSSRASANPSTRRRPSHRPCRSTTRTPPGPSTPPTPCSSRSSTARG